MVSIAFYKAEHGTIWDKAIAWWTRPVFLKFLESGKYSHVELIFSNQMWVSASNRDNRVRRMYHTPSHTPEHWDITELNINASDEIEMMARFLEIEGQAYDWKGIWLNEFLPLGIENPFKWYCSEAVAWILGKKKFHISPNDFQKDTYEK